MELSDENLQTVYTWVDEIPLSRPKRNISRDFSDGVLTAEIVHHYYPKLVDLHNYSAANSFQQKIYNWKTLNNKVLKRLGFLVNKHDISDIVNAKPQTIELVLLRLREKISEKSTRTNIVQSQRMKQESSSTSNNTELKPQDSDQYFVPSQQNECDNFTTRFKEVHETIPQGRQSQNLNDLMWEKDQTIHELRDTIEILELKIKKMEQLLKLKDSKILSLQNSSTISLLKPRN